MTGGPAKWRASIRLRLLAGLLMLILAGLLGSFLATSILLQSYLEDGDRRMLRESGQRVRELVGRGPRIIDGEQVEALLGAPLGAVVVSAGDRAVAATGSADKVAPALVAGTKDRANEIVNDDITGADEVLALRIPTQDLTIRLPRARRVEATAVILTINTDIDEADVRELFRTQGIVVGATVLLMMLIALVVLRVGLRPLREMASTAEAIASGARDRRLEMRGGGPEAAQLARAVNRAFDAQADAERKIRAFAADASHELRTPLTTISGWLDLYHQGGLGTPAARDRALERVDVEVGRMRLMVEELALLARLDAGRALQVAEVDVARLAADVVEDAQVINRDRIVTVATSGPALVDGDEPRLAQVLRNLVGNGVQHTPPDATVQVAVRATADAVVVDVRDDGPGIPPEQLPHLFERFWRAEASRNRAHGGSGLGLAIVEAIVTAHGGSMSVASTPGEGTTFTVHLPAAARGPAARPSRATPSPV